MRGKRKECDIAYFACLVVRRADLTPARLVLGAEHVEHDNKQNDAARKSKGCLGDVEIGDHPVPAQHKEQNDLSGDCGAFKRSRKLRACCQLD